MIHLYLGDGKGKTTCAMGLALRAAGRGKRVVIAQFLKGAGSGKRLALALLPGVTLLPVPEKMPFFSAMSEKEKAETAAQSALLLSQAAELVAKGECDFLVLDEICVVLSLGLLPLEAVTRLADACPAGMELVLTGRKACSALLHRADYITEMKNHRHPYDSGVKAREGIEY
jgi:cob(I)alamin adenosyltransferase